LGKALSNGGAFEFFVLINQLMDVSRNEDGVLVAKNSKAANQRLRLMLSVRL
jgi:hypothetical protein